MMGFQGLQHFGSSTKTNTASTFRRVELLPSTSLKSRHDFNLPVPINIYARQRETGNCSFPTWLRLFPFLLLLLLLLLVRFRPSKGVPGDSQRLLCLLQNVGLDGGSPGAGRSVGWSVGGSEGEMGAGAPSALPSPATLCSGAAVRATAARCSGTEQNGRPKCLCLSSQFSS